MIWGNDNPCAVLAFCEGWRQQQQQRDKSQQYNIVAYSSNFCLETKPLLFCETQLCKIGNASKLEHGWRAAHEDLCIFGRSIEQAVLLQHFFGNKASRILPSTGGWSIECVMQFEAVWEILGQGLQLVPNQNIVHSCDELKENENVVVESFDTKWCSDKTCQRITTITNTYFDWHTTASP